MLAIYTKIYELLFSYIKISCLKPVEDCIFAVVSIQKRVIALELDQKFSSTSGLVFLRCLSDIFQYNKYNSS